VVIDILVEDSLTISLSHEDLGMGGEIDFVLPLNILRLSMNPYRSLVAGYARLLEEGRSMPRGGFQPPPRPAFARNAPKVLFFAPHPDDECIVGALALRLMRQARARIINVAVTLGSKPERRVGRLRELRHACRYLGYQLATTALRGLDLIKLETCRRDFAQWTESVAVIVRLLQIHQPGVVFCPHDRDWNSTHIGTHFLVLDALRRMPRGFECYVVETEFWAPMSDPNLMVEVGAEEVADMMAATSFHAGEVSRNPYHLLLAPWMMDNVRRGAELVGGKGAAAPPFTFAALYRLRRWRNGKLEQSFQGGKQVPCSMNVGDLFE
jgi:N-acetylglucosamine malate deacetylase 1